MLSIAQRFCCCYKFLGFSKEYNKVLKMYVYSRYCHKCRNIIHMYHINDYYLHQSLCGGYKTEELDTMEYEII